MGKGGRVWDGLRVRNGGMIEGGIRWGKRRRVKGGKRERVLGGEKAEGLRGKH